MWRDPDSIGRLRLLADRGSVGPRAAEGNPPHLNLIDCPTPCNYWLLRLQFRPPAADKPVMERERADRVSGQGHVAVLAPLAVAALAMLASRLGPSPSVCFDVAWTAAALSALIGTWLARRAALEPHRSRWTWWAMAAAAWLFGQLAWDVYAVSGFPRSPNLADAGWWAFALFTMVSVLQLADLSRQRLAVRVIETGPLVVAAVALTTAQFWGSAHASSLPLAAKLSALAYPALYVSAAVLMLDAVVGGGLRRIQARGLTLVLSGVTAEALAFTLWCNKLLKGTYVPGHTWLDRLWVIGMAAIAVGGLVAARNPEQL